MRSKSTGKLEAACAAAEMAYIVACIDSVRLRRVMSWATARCSWRSGSHRAVQRMSVFADVAIFKLQLQAAFHDTVCLLLGGLAVCRVDEIEHLETHSFFRGVPKNAFKRRAHVDHLAVGIDDTDCVEQEIHNVLGRYSLHWRFPVLLSGCKSPQWSPSIACRVIQEMTPHFAGGIPSVSATHTCCEKRYAPSIFSKIIGCYVFDSCWRFLNKGWRPVLMYFVRRPSYLGIQQNG